MITDTDRISDQETMLVENGMITESNDHSIVGMQIICTLSLHLIFFFFVGINFREYITKQ